ncbi:helix-turn-helix transcriptional regulator [Nocardiopsis rhodophaea]
MVEKGNGAWLRWGTELRRLRERAGKTQDQLGRSVGISRQLIGAFENGTRTPKAEHCDILDRELATGGTLRQLWSELSDTDELSEGFRGVLRMERVARRIREYHPILIPGLLQVPDYSRTLISARQVGIPSERIEAVVKARSERLEAVLPESPALWFVVDEVVITRPIGNRRIMRDQLQHIEKLMSSGKVRLQVIPNDIGHHPGLCTPFRIFELPTGTLLHMENTFGGQSFREAEKVNRMLSLFGALQAEAYPPRRSIDLIRTALSELK